MEICLENMRSSKKKKRKNRRKGGFSLVEESGTIINAQIKITFRDISRFLETRREEREREGEKERKKEKRRMNNVAKK